MPDTESTGDQQLHSSHDTYENINTVLKDGSVADDDKDDNKLLLLPLSEISPVNKSTDIENSKVRIFCKARF